MRGDPDCGVPEDPPISKDIFNELGIPKIGG